MEQSSDDGRAGKRVPRTGAVIIGDTFMQRDAGACADLVAEDETGEKLCPCAPRTAVDCGQERRQYRNAGVSLGKHVTVVCVERVDRRCPRECRAGAARTSAIEQEARF